MAQNKFSKLESKLGKATKLDGYINEVCTYDDKPKSFGHRGSEPEAYESLMIHLVSSNQWYSASAAAVNELFRNLDLGARRDIVLALIADIACADHVNGWMARCGTSRIPADIVEALNKNYDKIIASFQNKDARARAAVAMLAGCIDNCLQYKEHLIQLTKDEDNFVQASAWLALGKLSEVDENIGKLIHQAINNNKLTAFVRGAAAVAYLRAVPSENIKEFQDVLSDWLDTPFNKNPQVLHWFGGVWRSWAASKQKLSASARALMELALRNQQQESVIYVALEVINKQQTVDMLESISGLVLALGDFVTTPGDINTTLTPNEFTSFQQQLLPALANSVVPTTAGYGLPAAGVNRRRWLGLEAPGPLEKIYPETNGQPLWLACQLQDTELPKSLTGFERWQALLELRLNPYAKKPKYNIEQELGQLIAETIWHEKIVDVIEKLILSAEICNMLNPNSVGRTFGQFAVMPLLRAGIPVSDKWVSYVWTPNTNIHPDMLSLLPPHQREQVLKRIFWPDTNKFHDKSVQLDHIQYLHLSPTPEIVDLAIVLVQQAKEDGWDFEKYMKPLADLANDNHYVANAFKVAGLV